VLFAWGAENDEIQVPKKSAETGGHLFILPIATPLTLPLHAFPHITLGTSAAVTFAKSISILSTKTPFSFSIIIRKTVKNSKIWIKIDETIDATERTVATLIFGILYVLNWRENFANQ
jgi:hypothetical protein